MLQSQSTPPLSFSRLSMLTKRSYLFGQDYRLLTGDILRLRAGDEVGKVLPTPDAAPTSVAKFVFSYGVGCSKKLVLRV